MELHDDGYRFRGSSDKELPYLFGSVADAVGSSRAAQALAAHQLFRRKVAGYVLTLYALGPEHAQLVMVIEEQP